MWIHFKEATDFDLREGVPTGEQIKEALNGGWLEGLTIRGAPGGRCLTAYVDEEGKLKSLPPTMIYPAINDVLCGPVIITATDTEGETVPMTCEEVTAALPKRHSRTLKGPLPVLDVKPYPD